MSATPATVERHTGLFLQACLRALIRAEAERRVPARFTESGPVHTLTWHAPLTAVAGAKRCPKDGEEMSASWSYCPWHGTKLESSPAK